jgi:hypothetical protein
VKTVESMKAVSPRRVEAAHRGEVKTVSTQAGRGGSWWWKAEAPHPARRRADLSPLARGEVKTCRERHGVFTSPPSGA